MRTGTAAENVTQESGRCHFFAGIRWLCGTRCVRSRNVDVVGIGVVVVIVATSVVWMGIFILVGRDIVNKPSNTAT